MPESITRVMNAARDYTAASEELRGLRGKRQRCTEYDRGDMNIGDPGSPPCDLSDNEPDNWCEACQITNEIYKQIRVAKRRQRLALARLVRAVAREDSHA